MKYRFTVDNSLYTYDDTSLVLSVSVASDGTELRSTPYTCPETFRRALERTRRTLRYSFPAKGKGNSRRSVTGYHVCAGQGAE